MKLGSQPWFKSHIYILTNSKRQANMKYIKNSSLGGGANIIKHGRESECHCYIQIITLNAGSRHGTI